MPSSTESDYSFTCIERPNYLHFIVTGTSNPDAILASGMEIVDRSKSSDFECILIEDKFTGPRMEPIDIYAMLSEVSKSARLLLRAVAIVDEQLGDTKQFAESVAANRGLNLALFRVVTEAEGWLLEQIGDN